VFAFILAITDVNICLAFKYFVWKTTPTISFLQFQQKLAKALICNEYISLDEEDDVTPRKSKRQKSKRQRRQQDHIKQTAPNHVLSPVIDTKSILVTYCKCSPGVWLCEDHFVQHRIEVQTVPESPQPN
jgi:hypothetical protein